MNPALPSPRPAIIVRNLLCLLLLVAAPALLHAQESTAPPRLFLDCSGFYCDRDYLQTEVDFVRYVRDRQDADVHLLITTQRTGGGGTEYTLSFVGRERFSGMQDTLRYIASQTETEAEERQGLARFIKLGLARYLARTPLASGLEIHYAGGAAEEASPPTADPWNSWTFRVSARGRLEDEAGEREQSLFSSVSASRVTEEWKLDFDADGEYEHRRFEYMDEGVEKVESAERWEYEVEGLAARSLGDHWAAGALGSVSASTRQNQDRALRLAPALEYSIFPYAEATRRQITLRYSVGTTYFDYIEETLYGEMAQWLLNHALAAEVDVAQTWGSVNLSAEAFQYASDPSRYRAELGGDLDVRLFRGLSVNVFGGISYLRDQIYLPGGDLSPEEIFLELSERETAYRYELGLGFSYTFGSVYSAVVNPRFD